MIKILCIGKIKEKYLDDAIDEYKKRINKYTKLEIIEINDEATNNPNVTLQKEKEKILNHINKKDYKMKYFVFDIYDKNDNKIASSIGYASNVIKKGQKVKINSNVDIDITGAKKITITIE